jgi:hypothetical protein
MKKKNKLGRPRFNCRLRKRINFSIDADVADLFFKMFEKGIRSQMIEKYLRKEIGLHGTDK